MTTALDGLRVLDFTWGLPGALATMILADNGADVVKVEPPGGDPQRGMPAFAQWHRGKRSTVLDLSAPADRDRARELAGTSDVVLQSWRPGVVERLGLGYDAVSADNPGVVYCAITGFGPRGPLAGLRGYDAVVGAKMGLLAYQDRPRYSAVLGASFAASQAALQGILAALYVKGGTGRGQKVETSLVQGLQAYDLYNWLGPQLQGEMAARPRSGMTFAAVSGMVGFTSDGGWLQFSNFRPHLVDAFIDAIGLTDWYRDAVARQAPSEEIVDGVLRRLHERTLREWMEVFMTYDDIGVEPFRTPLEAMDHPQVLHNGNVIEAVDPVLGKTRQLGPLVSLAATPSVPGGPAPTLGADPEASFPARPDQVPAPGGGRPGKGPLTGVTVVELAWFYAAPFGTALLADLGARVIKVEGRDGDPHRYMNPLREFSGVKALGGKQSVVVDYRTAEGKEILHRLIARADIVMRNYRQQNSAAVGDDYDSLRPHNPEQVYLYAGAYGSDGPYTTRPAFAPTMGVAAGQKAYQLGWPAALGALRPITFEEGTAGLAAQSRNSGGPTVNADAAAAMVVGTAQLLGLVARQRTGHGQYLETSMLCSNAYVVSDEFFDHEGRRPGAHHDENGVNALYRLYETADGWVFLAAPLPADWDALRDALGLDGDDRFSTPEGRAARDAELAQAISAVLMTRPAGQWESSLLAADVTCVEVSQRPFSELTIDGPAVRDNGFVAEVSHPLFGTHLRHGPVASLSATPGAVGPACLVGQHTRQVLDELGYDAGQIADLESRGIVFCGEGT